VKQRVLFVCLGNICRSPTAEAVFRDLVKREAAGLLIDVDSAGTQAYHTGSPPDARSVAAAARRGIEMSGRPALHRAGAVRHVCDRGMPGRARQPRLNHSFGPNCCPSPGVDDQTE